MIQLNGHDITPYITRFPDGCSQVWKLPEEWFDVAATYAHPYAIVRWYFESEAELVPLLQLCSLLVSRGQAIELVLPYLPYGRQDRDAANDVCFGLRPFLVAVAPYISILALFDPHSLRLVDHDDFVDDYDLTWNTPPLTGRLETYDTVCFPDQGALDKYAASEDDGGIELAGLNVIHGHKVREQTSGKITHYEIVGMASGKVLVVDDICDGGATFMLLATALEKQDPESVDLYISHGVFSKGQDGINALLQKYDRVICTDSRPVAQYEGLTVLPCPI